MQNWNRCLWRTVLSPQPATLHSGLVGEHCGSWACFAAQSLQFAPVPPLPSLGSRSHGGEREVAAGKAPGESQRPPPANSLGWALFKALTPAGAKDTLPGHTLGQQKLLLGLLCNQPGAFCRGQGSPPMAEISQLCTSGALPRPRQEPAFALALSMGRARPL